MLMSVMSMGYLVASSLVSSRRQMIKESAFATIAANKLSVGQVLGFLAIDRVILRIRLKA